MISSIKRISWPLRIGIVAVVVGLLAATAMYVFTETAQHKASAYFTQAKGIYEGDDVQILGVRVGTVTTITPEPGRVRIDFTYESHRVLPADVKAVIMAPSVVPVRNLTLSPAYKGGPQLADGDVIPQARTAVPVEWDDMKKQLTELTGALGPKGANTHGSLSNLLDTSATNLRGQGADINDTLHSLSEAMATIGEGSGDFFANVRNMQVFVEALVKSNGQVADFNHRLADVSGLLSDNSGELNGALDGLNSAFEQVTGFLHENRPALSGAVRDLQPLSDMLARNRQQLADALHFAPTALSNFYNIYDPNDGSLNGALSTANVQAPATMICSAIYNLGGGPEQCQQALGPLAKLATLQPPPVGLSPIERNGRSNMVAARPGPEAAPGSPEAKAELKQLLSPGGP